MDKTHIYAFVDEEDGIIALGNSPESPFPAVFLSERLAYKMYPMIKGFMAAKGRPFKLLKYSNPVDIADDIYAQLKKEGFKY